MDLPTFKSKKEKENFIDTIEDHKIEGFTFNEEHLKAIMDYHHGRITQEDVLRMVKNGDFNE